MYRFLLILAVCFSICIADADAQRKELRRFTSEYSDVAHAHSFGFSFLPLRIISWFIPAKAFDGDAREVKWALKRVRGFRAYVIAGEEVTPESIDLLKEDLYKTRKYEPLMEMKRKGANVEVLGEGKDVEELGDLVVMIQEKDNMVMMHLRTKIKMKDLGRLIDRLQDQATVSLLPSQSPPQAYHSPGE